MAKTERISVAFQLLECGGEVERNHRQMVPGRLEILPDGEHLAAGGCGLGHHLLQLGHRLSQTDHDPRLGQALSSFFAIPAACPAQQFERPPVIGTRTNLRIEPGHGPRCCG